MIQLANERNTNKRMGKRRKKRKALPPQGLGTQKVLLEYHQLPFALFHKDLEKLGYDGFRHHDIAQSFWNIVPPGIYDSLQAKPILEKYSEVLEREIGTALAKHSIAYWLHAYRRLFPGPMGDNAQPHTVQIVRSTLESAIPKYGKSELCSGVGFSAEVSSDAIFKGILCHPRFKPLRDHLRLNNQLVLTDFDVNSLRELYELEKVAYQIWRVGATLRIVGKGAKLVVDSSHPGGFYDARSEELDRLVKSYDGRLGEVGASSTGTTYDASPRGQTNGTVFLGRYNTSSVKVSEFEKIFASFGPKLRLA
jgi:hypothetical protein